MTKKTDHKVTDSQTKQKQHARVAEEPVRKLGTICTQNHAIFLRSYYALRIIRSYL